MPRVLPKEVAKRAAANQTKENMMTELTKGGKMWRRREMSTIFRTIQKATRELLAVRAEARATPLTPINLIRIGVNIQVRIVHMTISFRVVVTRPVALRVLVKVMEIEEKRVLTPILLL